MCARLCFTAAAAVACKKNHEHFVHFARFVSKKHVAGTIRIRGAKGKRAHADPDVIS